MTLTDRDHRPPLLQHRRRAARNTNCPGLVVQAATTCLQSNRVPPALRGVALVQNGATVRLAAILDRAPGHCLQPGQARTA